MGLTTAVTLGLSFSRNLVGQPAESLPLYVNTTISVPANQFVLNACKTHLHAILTENGLNIPVSAEGAQVFFSSELLQTGLAFVAGLDCTTKFSASQS